MYDAVLFDFNFILIKQRNCLALRKFSLYTLFYLSIFFELNVMLKNAQIRTYPVLRDVSLFSAGVGGGGGGGRATIFGGEGHDFFLSCLGEGHNFFQGFLGEGHNFLKVFLLRK